MEGLTNIRPAYAGCVCHAGPSANGFHAFLIRRPAVRIGTIVARQEGMEQGDSA